MLPKPSERIETLFRPEYRADQWSQEAGRFLRWLRGEEEQPREPFQRNRFYRWQDELTAWFARIDDRSTQEISS